MFWLCAHSYFFLQLIMFLIRINGFGNNILAIIELVSLTLLIFILSLSCKVETKYVRNNPILLAWIAVILMNIFISLVSGVVSDADYWLQNFGLNIRNLITGVFAVFFASHKDFSQKNLSMLVLFCVLYGFLQSILGMLSAYSFDALMQFGVGVSFIVLFCLYLMLSSNSKIAKFFYLGLAFAGNSLTAFVAFLLGLFIYRPLISLIPIAVVCIFLVLFISGSFGDFLLFRKSPEVLLSGTGRFRKYADCLDMIATLRIGGDVCHGSYLTIISKNGLLGIFQVALLFIAAIVHYLQYLKRLSILNIFPIICLVFILGNDFILNTPSQLTFFFILFLMAAQYQRKSYLFNSYSYRN